MDPLSAVASVIAVVQISSKLFGLCQDYYLDAKHARQDVERLRGEATSLQDVLVKIADLVESDTSSSFHTLALVQRDDGPLKQCRADLTALVGKLELSDGAGKFKLKMRTLKWPLSKNEIDKTLVKIEKYKSSFNLALSSDHA